MANDAWQECMTDEQMEDIIQKYLSNLKKKMMSLDIRNKKKKRFYFLPENEEVPKSSENINPQAVRRIREYVELNYGNGAGQSQPEILYRNPQKLYPVSYRWNITEPCD